MREPTDNMVDAYTRAWRARLFERPQDQDRPAVRAGLAAVLALLRRDCAILPKADMEHMIAAVRLRLLSFQTEPYGDLALNADRAAGIAVATLLGIDEGEGR